LGEPWQTEHNIYQPLIEFHFNHMLLALLEDG